MVDRGILRAKVDSVLSGIPVGGGGPPEELVDIGREIAQEHEITKYDFITFRSMITDEGATDEQASEIWDRLREEDVIAEGTVDDAPRGGHPPAHEELGVDPDEVDRMVLLTEAGCPACQEAKDRLSEWIDDGLVEVHDIQESDEGVDIAMEEGIEGVPALLVDTGEEFIQA
jgi:hypothetical protein